MRNPKWHRDEIILALDLYYDLEPGQMNSTNTDTNKARGFVRSDISNNRLDNDNRNQKNNSFAGIDFDSHAKFDQIQANKGFSITYTNNSSANI